MTLLTEEARRERIEAALDAHDPGREERVRVPWKGDSALCPVVRVSLDAAALNPHSHRIKAELESDPNREEIEADPYSEQSQERIAEILRNTERYADLRENIAAEGQLDYGVITNAGLLVNANTRAVALRDVDEHYVEVAVLPGDATEKEIADLEVKLQMQRDFKQDYTFTNELLFVHDLTERFDYTTQQVAEILRRREREVEQFIRILSTIREVQRRTEGKMPLKEFDDKEQLLKDLDQAYEGLKEGDPDAATRLREARILSLLVGTYYRDARQADEEFVEDYLSEALVEDEDLGESLTEVLESSDGEAAAGEELPGVGELGGGEEEQTGGGAPRASALVDLVAKSVGEDEIKLPTKDGGEQTASRERVVEAIAEAISDAAAESKADAKREKGLSGPIALLKDARRKLQKVLPAYRDVADDEEFDNGAFAYESRKLKTEAEELHAEVEKHEKD